MVQKAQERSEQSVDMILEQLALSPATHYCWKSRQQRGALADRAGQAGHRNQIILTRSGTST
jgi:hypothetical protein